MERNIDRQKYRDRQRRQIKKDRQIEKRDRQISQLLFIVDNIQSDKEKNKTNWWQIVEWIVEYNLVLFTVLLQKKKESIMIEKLKIKLNRKMGMLN